METTKKNDQVEYDKWWGEFLSLNIEDPGTTYRTDLVVKEILNLGTKNIVDVGCGSGELIKKITKNVPGVLLTGLDVSPVIIERNRKEIKNANFDTINLNEDSRFNNKFDMVICCEVIEHVKDWKNAIKGISNLVDTSGYVIVTTQAGKMHKHHKALSHLKHFKKEEIENELTKNGIKILKSYYSGWPFMNLKNYLISIFYNSIENSLFKSQKQSTMNKIAFKIFKFLYAISSKKYGPQIFILGKK